MGSFSVGETGVERGNGKLSSAQLSGDLEGTGEGKERRGEETRARKQASQGARDLGVRVGWNPDSR